MLRQVEYVGLCCTKAEAEWEDVAELEKAENSQLWVCVRRWMSEAVSLDVLVLIVYLWSSERNLGRLRSVAARFDSRPAEEVRMLVNSGCIC